MIDEWAERLQELGLDAHAEAVGPARRGVRRGVLYLARGGSACEYELRCGQQVALSAVGAGEDGRTPFVLTTYVAPRIADAFRRAGVQYLDRSGNAWIEFSEVLIDVRGRRRLATAAAPRNVAGNLFSSGRAQVVFALLAWPQLWDATQREVAKAAGVSVGQVNSALKLLRQSGYLRTGTRPGQADLLDLWAATFPSGLAHRITLARYNGPLRRKNLTSAALSGAAAMPDLARSPAAVLYVDKLDPRMPIANKWRSDGDPNITIRRRFWTEPTNVGDSRKVAPWPLVYADLLASDDPRERAAAKEWRERHP